jgi:hypothetical protein
MLNKVNLDSLIEDFKRVGDTLSSYQLSDNDEEVLKTNVLEIDGYSIILKFNRIDHGPFYSENLKLKAEFGSYLPFHLVAKLGKKFLGKHQLMLIESFENDNKVYEWKIALDKDGRPAPVRIHNYYEECVYDDLNYIYFTSY